MGSNLEAVNHPPHYGGENDAYEAIKVIEAWQLGFHLGNVLKYIRRADNKDSYLLNLKKARWYLDRKIARIEEELKPGSFANPIRRTTPPDPHPSSLQTTIGEGVIGEAQKKP